MGYIIKVFLGYGEFEEWIVRFFRGAEYKDFGVEIVWLFCIRGGR